jgi:hypothetical protein
MIRLGERMIRMSLGKRHLAFTVLTVLATTLFGCLGSDPGPTASEIRRSDSTSATGKNMLDSVFRQISSSDFRYGKSDLTQLKKANATFTQAVKRNRTNHRHIFQPTRAYHCRKPVK